MQPTKFIWMNGKLVPWAEAKVHVLAHSLHYGSAVFEGIRFYETGKGPAIFRLPEHLERLFHSADVFGMDIGLTKEELKQAIIETIKANKLTKGYIRPIIYLGYGNLGVGPKNVPLNMAIAVWPWEEYLEGEAVRVKTSSVMRTHPKTTDVASKISGNYQNSILAILEVRKQGYDEALLLDYQGNVAEGPAENFFMVKDGTLITPPLGTILPGITRDSVMTLAKEAGITVQEKPLKLDDVYNADEVFFTGTAAEVQPIASVDDHSFKAPGALTKKLSELYLEAVHGKNEKHVDWLTFI